MANAIRIELDFAIARGTFGLEVSWAGDTRVLGVFGPSGSGKTTCLEAIAGLAAPARGRINVGGRVLFDRERRVDLPPRARRVGYVPQDALLFPHMDVRRNVLYGANRGSDQARRMEQVLDVLEAAALLDRPVAALSGGERQRIAVARALMSSPDLLLLDEPLASVDFPLRRRIVTALGRIRDELGVPAIYVTHDPEELRSIADHILVLDSGRVVASGEASAPLFNMDDSTRPRS
jgi:molybdate transport system ATP-binding protein